MTNKRWIRTWHYNRYPADMQGVPATGDFAGAVDFDRIDGLYPSRHDPTHLNITLKGKHSSDGTWLTVRRVDVHQIEPSLAATFPLAVAGSGK